MRRVLTHILVSASMLTSLAAAPRANDDPGSSKAPSKTIKRHRHNAAKPYQVGKASWYGKYFHGRMTASGEPYDMFQLTAAHRQLPLGTVLRVTNLQNGRWVIVRVNDRGPVPRTRIIDLSYGAAELLDLRRPGVETVRLDIVEAPATLASTQASVGMP